MAEIKTMKKQEVVDFLTKGGEGKKVVLLFDDTMKKNKFSSQIEKEIKDAPGFTIDRGVPFRITNSVVELSDRKIILGIKHHEEQLQNHYENEEILYYEEGND